MKQCTKDYCMRRILLLLTAADRMSFFFQMNPMFFKCKTWRYLGLVSNMGTICGSTLQPGAMGLTIQCTHNTFCGAKIKHTAFNDKAGYYFKLDLTWTGSFLHVMHFNHITIPCTCHRKWHTNLELVLAFLWSLVLLMLLPTSVRLSTTIATGTRVPILLSWRLVTLTRKTMRFPIPWDARHAVRTFSCTLYCCVPFHSNCQQSPSRPPYDICEGTIANWSSAQRMGKKAWAWVCAGNRMSPRPRRRQGRVIELETQAWHNQAWDSHA